MCCESAISFLAAAVISVRRFLRRSMPAPGKLRGRIEAFAKVSFVAADGKVILLDEDGNLGLVTMSAEGLRILSRASVADRDVVDCSNTHRQDALLARPRQRGGTCGWCAAEDYRTNLSPT